jgi:hypothetical protein
MPRVRDPASRNGPAMEKSRDKIYRRRTLTRAFFLIVDIAGEDLIMWLECGITNANAVYRRLILAVTCVATPYCSKHASNLAPTRCGEITE